MAKLSDASRMIHSSVLPGRNRGELPSLNERFVAKNPEQKSESIMQKSLIKSHRAPIGAGALAAVLLLTGLADSSGQPQPGAPATSVPGTPSPARAKAEAQTKLTALRLERDKDPVAARAGYRDAIALDLACPLPYLHLGRLADAEEKWEEAVTNFAQFVKLDAVSDDSVQTQLRMDELKKLVEQDKTPEGKRNRVYGAAVARIQIATKEGRLADAAKEAAAAVQIDPQRLQAYAQGAAALAKQERFADAQPLLKKALELADDEKKPAIQAALDQCEKELQGATLAKAASEALDAKDYVQAQKKFAEAFALLPSRETWGLSAALAAGMAEDYYGCKQLLQILAAGQDASVAEQARSRLAKVEDLLTERDVQGAELRAKTSSSGDLMTLGGKYEEGNGIPKDARQAFACYQAAVQSQNWGSDAFVEIRALLKMEQMYRSARGTPKNEATATEHFQKALALVTKLADAESNKSWGKYNSACFYSWRAALWPRDNEGGHAAAKDKAEAMVFLNSAVDLGYRDHQKMASDADLAVLQDDSAFQEIVQRAKQSDKQEKALLEQKKAEEQVRMAPKIKSIFGNYTEEFKGEKNRKRGSSSSWLERPYWVIRAGEDSFTISKKTWLRFDDIGGGFDDAVEDWAKRLTCQYSDLHGISIRSGTADGTALTFYSSNDSTEICAEEAQAGRLRRLFDELKTAGVPVRND